MTSIQDAIKIAITKVESDFLEEYRSAKDQGVITHNEHIHLYEKMREITVRIREELIRE